MTKYEVMRTLRKEFDEEVLPYYYKSIFPRLKSSLYQKCLREKKTITLGWVSKKTTGHNTFKILKRGNPNRDMPLFVCEFRWNGKLCYGNFFPEKHVVIYQAHSLQRYAERVLGKEISISNVFYDYLVKNQKAAYNITLTTPTHQHTQYFGLANALFLGDFDIEHPKDPFIWINTCISYKEAGYSQSRIMQSLHELQIFVDGVGEDLSKSENKNLLKDYIKRNIDNAVKIESLKRFLTQKYLLWKLHINCNFSFADIFKDDISKALQYIEKYLLQLGIQPKSLSPFSKTNGIAWKGEIDYKG